MTMPADVVREAAAAAVAAGRDEPDPVARAVAYHRAVKAVQELMTALVLARRSAVVEARTTRAVDEIALALGERRTKVYQIANGVARG